MAHIELETDYLIVGSGAVGMAFADTLLTDDSKAKILLVDKHHKPGGHWNVAYPFVTLHQPSAFYGVSSLELSKGKKDEVGLNKGLQDLASGAEILAYFDEVMNHRFLPSGRVQYFPLCQYDGDGQFTHLLNKDTYSVKVNKKTVDATYLKTSVPATHTPNFSIADKVQFMPLNDLPKVMNTPEKYVIIGGGKTGIDACLWLLAHNINPNNIQWIVSRDAWLIDRKNTQASEEFFQDSIGAQANQMEAIALAESIPDMFDRLEAARVLLRLDQEVRPTMFHGATISQLELEALRKIKDVVRLGRVKSIETDQIILEKGHIPTNSNTLHVDCSASAIPAALNDKHIPIFQGKHITPQTVRSYQPVFSASFIAHVEASYATEEEKNALCGIVPLPNHDTDYVRFTAAFMRNQHNWSRDKELRKWLLGNRLDGFSELMASIKDDDVEKLRIVKKLRDNAVPAMGKLHMFLQQLSQPEQSA